MNTLISLLMSFFTLLSLPTIFSYHSFSVRNECLRELPTYASFDHICTSNFSFNKLSAGISGSSCLHLQHKFKNLCWQLSDLNHTFAQFTTKCLLRSLMDNLLTKPTPAISKLGSVRNCRAHDPSCLGKKLFAMYFYACYYSTLFIE